MQSRLSILGETTTASSCACAKSSACTAAGAYGLCSRWRGQEYLGCDQRVRVVVGVHSHFQGLSILPDVHRISALQRWRIEILPVGVTVHSRESAYFTPSGWIVFSYGSEKVYCTCDSSCHTEKQILAVRYATTAAHLERRSKLRRTRF